MPEFLFVTCQIGAERAVKGELARRWPGFRFAFSRPGFLTFKLPEEHGLAGDFDLQSVFARAYGFSLGEVIGHPRKDRTAVIWDIYKDYTIQKVHVWEKDWAVPGEHSFEPVISPAAVETHRIIVEHCPRPASLGRNAVEANDPARPGEMVLDCVILDGDLWWTGYHRVKSFPSRYPGGMLPLELPPDAVSRAWLKMEEALRWSQLPIPRGARVAEIGSGAGRGEPVAAQSGDDRHRDRSGGNSPAGSRSSPFHPHSPP